MTIASARNTTSTSPRRMLTKIGDPTGGGRGGGGGVEGIQSMHILQYRGSCVCTRSKLS